MFNWLSFLTYAVVTAATPGPNNILSMSNGGRLGFKRALPFNFGIGVGFAVVMAICTLFSSMLSSAIPKIEFPMLLIGAAYMLHLAWKTYKSSAGIEENYSRSGFIAGFTLQFVNPKIYVYIIVSMEAYVLPYYAGQPLIIFGFAMLLTMIGFLFTLCWSAFGSIFKLLFSKYAKLTNTIMALFLVYSAVSLFL